MSEMTEIMRKQREVLDRLRKRSMYVGYSKYSIVLLLDVSGSMSGVKIEDAKEAIIHFLRGVNLAENEVGLVAFGLIGFRQKPTARRIAVSELSRDYVHLEAKVRSFEAAGDTPMMIAIKAAYEKLLKEKLGPVMVIATDGQPTDASEEEILEYAYPIKREGVRIITIGIGGDVNQNFLGALASSAEDYHFAKASFELKKIYKEVADILALPGKRTDYLKEV